MLEIGQQALCQRKNINEIGLCGLLRRPGTSAIHAGRGRNFRPQKGPLAYIAPRKCPC
jgi:hypothetical protein